MSINTRRKCEIRWCDHLAGHGPRDARCRCHGPLVIELGPGSPQCPDAEAAR